MDKIENIFYSLVGCVQQHDVKKELRRLKDMINGQKIRVKSMIDFGCGDGSITRKVAGILSAREVWGMDLNHMLLEKAAEKNIKVLYHDISEPLKMENKFDLTFSYATLHHIKKIEKVIKQMKLVTKKYVVIVDNCKNEKSFKQKITTSILFPFELGKYARTPHKMLSIVKSVGIKVLDYRVFDDIHPYFDRIIILGEKR